MPKFFREKGRYEAGLHNWASEVDRQFHENSEIVVNFTYRKILFLGIGSEISSDTKGAPKGKEPLL